MVKHIIIWTLSKELSDSEKNSVKENIKEKLESLKEKINGIVEINVQIEPLPSSNGDLLLDSTFESEAALKAYTIHPTHVEIAQRYVRPFTVTRSCIDFEVK